MTPPTARIRVVIDRRLCVATSNCAEAAPDAFEMDEAGVPQVLTPGSPAAALAGAEACPVGAITCYDVDSGQRVFP